MNVLIATYLATNSPSGVVTYCKTLAADLAGAGVGVYTVDAAHTPNVWRKCLGVLKRMVKPLGSAFQVVYAEFAFFTAVYFAVRKAHRSGIDLIHAQDVRSGVAAWLAMGRRVPVVLTCHFNDDPVRELVDQYALKPGITRQLTSWYTYLFAQVHNYVFVSDYAYAKSKHLLPAVVNRITLPNTVRLNETTPTSTVDTGKLIITNVGYMDERKNQRLLIQVGHELRSRGIHAFMIWLIGDGPKRDECIRLASDLDLTDHVTFFGRQATPWLLVAQSDLYVHTALNDNCPYSIVEAFAVGTPVLALPVGGIPEMLPEGGLLHSAQADSIATEISRYFDSEQRNRLAAVQAAHAALSFNHRVNGGRLLSFYGQVVGHPTSVTTKSTLVS